MVSGIRTVSQLIYQAAGFQLRKGEQRCRICGAYGGGQPFDEWDKGSFTGRDLFSQSGDIICEACLFCFEEKSLPLMEKTSRDKPQKMRNYSHIVKYEEWYPLHKGQKGLMEFLLLEEHFPEVAIISETIQKHLIYRGRTNPPGRYNGYVLFEESLIYVERDNLKKMILVIRELLALGIPYQQIKTGGYKQHFVFPEMNRWIYLEKQLAKIRHTPCFSLAIFLA